MGGLFFWEGSSMGGPLVGGATGRDSLLFGLSPLKGKQQLFPLSTPSLQNSRLSLFRFAQSPVFLNDSL